MALPSCHLLPPRPGQLGGGGRGGCPAQARVRALGTALATGGCPAWPPTSPGPGPAAERGPHRHRHPPPHVGPTAEPLAASVSPAGVPGDAGAGGVGPGRPQEGRGSFLYRNEFTGRRVTPSPGTLGSRKGAPGVLLRTWRAAPGVPDGSVPSRLSAGPWEGTRPLCAVRSHSPGWGLGDGLGSLLCPGGFPGGRGPTARRVALEPSGLLRPLAREQVTSWVGPRLGLASRGPSGRSPWPSVPGEMGPWRGFAGPEVTTRGFSGVSSRAPGHTAVCGWPVSPGAPAPAARGASWLALGPGVPRGLPSRRLLLGPCSGLRPKIAPGEVTGQLRPAGPGRAAVRPAGAPAAAPPGPGPAPVSRPRLAAPGVARAAPARPLRPGCPSRPGPRGPGPPQVQLRLAGPLLRRVRPVPGLRARQLRGALAVQLRGQLGRPAVQQR